MQQHISLSDFYSQLQRHDWFYNFSDDNRVFRAGDADAKRLKQVATSNGPEYISLLEAYRAAKYSGQPWGTEQKSLPDRPA
jgi:hypothetical protein